ncbi:DUF4136 domain-containing protein [Hahella ganghwensis]|uniref:DUF4136 domain-containing protein n=1 Tax=Hahella ganghwensis TaxID=286420 RepID=UPI0003A7BE5B|nr:DUF4136 domain-containing protein [Hahella ganghwensis]
MPAIKGLQAIILILIQGVIIGCASTEHKPVVAMSQDLSADRYSGFVIENSSQREGDIYLLLNEGIQKVFTEKGYRPASDENASMRIRYLLLVERGQRLVEQVVPTGKGDLTKHYMEPVNEAKFLVNIVDMDSNQVVWKASTVRDISGKSLPSQVEVDEKLAAFFATFPEKK